MGFNGALRNSILKAICHPLHGHASGAQRRIVMLAYRLNSETGKMRRNRVTQMRTKYSSARSTAATETFTQRSRVLIIIACLAEIAVY